ncbi:hypothetical protein LINPERPRIM_LOCUS20592 [Linum perenne]
MVGHESWKPTGRAAIKAPRMNIDETKKRGRRTTKRMKGPDGANRGRADSGRVSKKGNVIRFSKSHYTDHNNKRCHDLAPTTHGFLALVAGIAALVHLCFIVNDPDNLFVIAEAVHSIGIMVLIYKLMMEKACAI